MVWSEGELDVRECICLILRTRPGERVERPTFGCGLDRFLFEPNTVTTLRLIQEEVKRALLRSEPRISLDDVRTELNVADMRAVDVTITYTLIATSQQERLQMTVGVGG